MRYSLCTALLMFGLSCLAQPVINSSDISPGWDEQYNYNSGFLMPGVGGEDVTWDYSSASGSLGASFVTVYPQWTANSKDFFGADYCWEVNGTLLYNNLDEDSWDYLGGVENGNVIVYTDPETYMTFPFTYGDEFTDTFGASFSIQGLDYVRTGEVSVECDGYGTLILPGQTYEDVLRVRMIETISDTTTIFSYTLVIESFNYYQAGVGNYIVSHGTYDYSDSDGIEISQPFNLLLDAVVVNTEDQEPMSEITVFPNPVADQLTISLPHWENQAHVVLYDAQGRLVMDTFVNASKSLDLDLLPPGLYILKAQTENNTYTTQIIKE